jgi:hybrid cluster-associated redox disulfide protein
MNKAKDIEKKQIITKDMNLADVIFKYPVIALVLLDHGLHCVGCIANAFDSIEGGAKIHGMSDEEIDDMVIKLNEAVYAEGENAE